MIAEASASGTRAGVKREAVALIDEKATPKPGMGSEELQKRLADAQHAREVREEACGELRRMNQPRENAAASWT
jgi:hypothetical protein